MIRNDVDLSSCMWKYLWYVATLALRPLFRHSPEVSVQCDMRSRAVSEARETWKFMATSREMPLRIGRAPTQPCDSNLSGTVRH